MTLRKSLAITFGTSYAELVLGFIAGVILTRILNPEDFGIYSIAASIAAVGYLFRNFGVGQFIIHAEELSEDFLRAAFTATLAVSWLIALILLIGAPLLADFYDNPGVGEVLYFLSFNFLILPFGAVSDAVLRRRMQFDKIAIIRIVSASANLVVAVTAAWLGARYMAIAWATNAATITTIALVLLYRPAGLPLLPGIRALREVLAFGIKVGTLDLVDKGSDSATELIIGKAYSLHDLGIYSRAFGTFMLFEYAFVAGFRPVMLPYLAETNRNKTPLGPVFMRIIAFSMMCMIPFFVFLYFNATDVLHVLYGHQWTASVPVLQVLCLAGIALAPTVYFEQVLIACGRPGLALQYQFTFQATRLLALLVLIGGSLQAAAAAFVIGALFKAGIVLYQARKLFAVQMGEFLRTLGPAVLTGLVVGISTLLLGSLLQGWSEPARLVAVSLCAGLVWLAMTFFLRHPIADEVKKLIDSRRKTTGN